MTHDTLGMGKIVGGGIYFLIFFYLLYKIGWEGGVGVKKIHKKDLKKNIYSISISIGPIILIGREIQCLPYARFFLPCSTFLKL